MKERIRRTWWFINILKFDDYCAGNIIANLHQLFYWNTGVILQHQYKTNYKESDSWVFASLRPLIIVNRSEIDDFIMYIAFTI